MLYTNFFFYSLQYFILINICISQEQQNDNLDLFSEKISSNNYTREMFPGIRNSIYTTNIEQDETLDLVNTSINFLTKQNNLATDDEDDPFNMSLVDTMNNLEKSESNGIKNIMDEVQSTLIDSLIEPFYSFFENEHSNIHTEKESCNTSLIGTKNVEHEDLVELQNILDEILNTSPDSRIESIDLSLERDYSTIQTEKESYRISLMGTKNVEHEDLVELQNILDEILNTSPDSREKSIDLSLEQDYSTIQTEKESYRISLMGTKNVEHEDLVELQNILDEILNTSPDSREESIDLSLEQDYSTIQTEKESYRISLMGTKNVEHEDLVELQNILDEILNTSPDSRE
ncbi:fam-j protein, partial [Plasmodium relictum]